MRRLREALDPRLLPAALGHALVATSAVDRSQFRGPAFYESADPLSEGAPGDLIRSERMTAFLSPGIPIRARAWRILYRSTSATGEPTAVSGTVLVPKGAKRGMPLAGYAIGTHGIGDQAAPSRMLARGTDYEAGLIAMTLRRGWAVAVTDYQGLGTPGDHTYMVGHALGPNVLDSMRAARNLLTKHLDPDGPAGVIGYSEGGYAAAWAAQLQPSYAPDVPLVGACVGAAAASTEDGARRLDGTFFSFFALYGAIGYAAAYPELDLDTYLTPKGREAIAMLRDSTIFGAALRGPRFVKAEEISSPNVLELPEWVARLRENRLGTIAPEAPTLLYHARGDQIVAYQQSLDLRDDWSALGADVRLYTTRGGFEHITGGGAGLPVALGWLARRFAGTS